MLNSIKKIKQLTSVIWTYYQDRLCMLCRKKDSKNKKEIKEQRDRKGKYFSHFISNYEPDDNSIKLI